MKLAVLRLTHLTHAATCPKFVTGYACTCGFHHSWAYHVQRSIAYVCVAYLRRDEGVIAGLAWGFLSGMALASAAWWGLTP